MDPFYPKAWGSNTNLEYEMVDGCLVHPQAQGILHYHIISPCLGDPSLSFQNLQPCEKIESCSNDILSYATSTFDGKGLIPIGFSKDGHIMYGPENESMA